MLHDLSYLPRQTRRRIEAWTEELTRHLYVPITPLVWEGFLTYEHLSPEDAEKRVFKPFPEGTKWGAKGQYGWFRTSFILPAEHRGRVLCSPIGIGGEMLVYFDRKAVGSIDRHHRLVYVNFDGEEAKHSLLVESYAGGDALLEGYGPIPPGREVYPPVPATQQQIKQPSVGYMEERAYQLYHDVFTLTNLLEVLAPTSLQAESIVAALLSFTEIVDFEQNREALLASYEKARTMLAPLLAWKNGSCAPQFTVFGQSHIDLAWKWTVEETKRKCGRTYSNQITLLKQYPEYRFLLCEPALVEMLRTYHPAIFREVTALMKTKQIIAEGAFWVECDTNLPSAASLIKQLVYGQRWFYAESGQYSTFAWLPDTFGFSASLPQLLIQSGVESFGTQKLLRADPESDPFPFTDFWWEGEDGTKILSNMCYRNNCEITPKELYKRWHVNRNQHENISGLIYPFGYGDGGGGPDRDLVEQMVRLKDLQGIPRLNFEEPKAYFDRIREKTLSVHRGELYLAWHRGSYSSQQRIKQLNAQCEQALGSYSFWTTLLDCTDEVQLDEWWKCVMFNQFHDILSGVSINKVNREAEAQLLGVLQESEVTLLRLLGTKVSKREGWYTVFNSSLHRVRDWIQFPGHGTVFQDSQALPSFRDGEHVYALVDLQPTAPTCFRLSEVPLEEVSCASLVKEDAHGYFFSNGTMSFRVDRFAVIRDITYQQRIICTYANALVLFQDINPDYDAWEIGKISLELPVTEAVVASMRILTDTPLMARLAITLHIGASTVEQIISFDGEANEIRVSLKVDWKERHKMLKSMTEHTFIGDAYWCDTQLGYKTLPLHANTVAARDRYEVCAQSYAAFSDEQNALLVMNSYPFGISARYKQVGLTLLRSALIPDERAEEGIHTLLYGFAIEKGAFSGLRAKRRASRLGQKFPVLPGVWKHLPFFSLISGSAEIISVEKSQKNGWMVRLSNPGNTTEQLHFATTLDAFQAWECTLLEEKKRTLVYEDGSYVLELPPFSLRTIVFSVGKSKKC